ncbi:hypothetical protein MHLP_03520 [Candidatus Mycoplasma haematolamae str. Purdue]|uniref:Uncharacterized protein n=1 Tax=Mycoplasma haematolamae (strain Purdue) TaxID=1212765 RepID=I7CK68_MYCHA|nr:hypothetical protein [Candidatus Mycoplasma haematolamae]AFO52284.1 hypothetical protein MHLP_03520 [Candidatus Mycoplasma haematolamae str. Purdue]
MIDKPTIREGMTLNLAKILDLQGKKDFDDAWKALPGIITEMVDFKKQTIRLAKSYAAGAGVTFAQKAWEGKWDIGKKVESPLSLIARAFRGKTFSEVCTKPEVNSIKSQFFSDECYREIKVEGATKAKVVDVLKSAYETGGGLLWSGTWNVVKKGAGGSWSEQTQLNNYSELKSKGYRDGLVVEQCPQLGPGWNIVNVLNDTANQKVCNKLLEAVFGSQVNQKRYGLCLLLVDP